MKDIVEILNSEISETPSTKQDIKSYIDSWHTESERRASYP